MHPPLCTLSPLWFNAVCCRLLTQSTKKIPSNSLNSLSSLFVSPRAAGAGVLQDLRAALRTSAHPPRQWLLQLLFNSGTRSPSTISASAFRLWLRLVKRDTILVLQRAS